MSIEKYIKYLLAVWLTLIVLGVIFGFVLFLIAMPAGSLV